MSKEPLTEDELIRLDEILDSIGGDAVMNIETLDGYFVALNCGADFVMPSEFLPEVFGNDYSFESAEQSTETIELLMRHWNTISTELQQTLHAPHVYWPVLIEREDGVAPANDWACGFARGMQRRPEGWRVLMCDTDYHLLMVPISILYAEHHSGEPFKGCLSLAEDREKLLQTMVSTVPQIYRYFESYRRGKASTTARVPTRRVEPKIGSNQPCPCGSGRKYKHCCMAISPTLH